MTEPINASKTYMRAVELLGYPALFTPYRVSRDTVHFNLYSYELQATAGPIPFYLMEQADKDFYGTVLLPVILTLPASGKVAVLGRIQDSHPKETYYTPAQFDELLSAASLRERGGVEGIASTEF